MMRVCLGGETDGTVHLNVLCRITQRGVYSHKLGCGRVKRGLA